MKKTSGKGLVELFLSIGIILIFHFFYFKVLSMIGINFSGISYEIANFIKYLLMCFIIFGIYHGKINSGKSKFNKSIFNSLIYSIACFIVLIIITVLLHRVLNAFTEVTGFTHVYNFSNFFNRQFSITTILSLVIEVIFIPFLMCVIFPLGISNVIKAKGSAALLSGILYAIFYIVINYSGISIMYAILTSIIPAVVMIFLTYLYKTNGNIWTVIVTYSMYLLFGIFAINYLLGA